MAKSPKTNYEVIQNDVSYDTSSCYYLTIQNNSTATISAQFIAEFDLVDI